MPRLRSLVSAVCLVALAAPALAGPRETLMNAAFSASSVPEAKQEVASALSAATAELAQDPNDSEAQLQQALAIGYRAKLTRNSGDAKRARQLFNAFLAAHPRDPEAQLALAGWNLDAIADLGPLLAKMVIGASKRDGLAALDRAVALGQNRALFAAYGALIRARLDPNDPVALRLAQQAVAAPTPTALDRMMQQRAASLLQSLRNGDKAGAATLAKRMLPFGTLNA